jgi:hypothetical protein
MNCVSFGMFVISQIYDTSSCTVQYKILVLAKEENTSLGSILVFCKIPKNYIAA